MEAKRRKPASKPIATCTTSENPDFSSAGAPGIAGRAGRTRELTTASPPRSVKRRIMLTPITFWRVKSRACVW